MSTCEMRTPATLSELAECLQAATAGTKLLGGGTDLTIQMKAGKETPAELIDLSGVRELHEITEDGEWIRIGAACTYTELEEHPIVRERLPALWQAASEVGSKQVRNRGTLGGNLANASPAGDSIPVLLALDASAVLLDGSGATRRLGILQLVTGVNQTALRPGEAIIQIELPTPQPTAKSAFVKLGARAKVTIAKISAAISFSEEDGVIRRAVIALGAVGERAFLSGKAARLLEGKPLGHALFTHLGDILSEEIEASIPTRASMPYKREAVRGLAEDLWLRLSHKPLEK